MHEHNINFAQINSSDYGIEIEVDPQKYNNLITEVGIGKSDKKIKLLFDLLERNVWVTDKNCLNKDIQNCDMVYSEKITKSNNLLEFHGNSLLGEISGHYISETLILKENIQLDNLKMGFVEKADFLVRDLVTDGRIG